MFAAFTLLGCGLVVQVVGDNATAPGPPRTVRRKTHAQCTYRGWLPPFRSHQAAEKVRVLQVAREEAAGVGGWWMVYGSGSRLRQRERRSAKYTQDGGGGTIRAMAE